jgi:hypothetical protein
MNSGLTLPVILFLTTLNAATADGIEELLTKTSSVIVGAVGNAEVVGPAITLRIEVNEVLLGSVGQGGSIAVECDGLKNVSNGPISGARPGIFFLRSTKTGGWACVPALMLGMINLGQVGYPLASPCVDGDLQLLAPKSARDRILARVAASALCGAFHPWPVVLDAAAPGMRRSDAPSLVRLDADFDFDRRVFKALMKSSRRDVYMDGFLGLIATGDPMPFDLIAKNPKEFQTDKWEWTTILDQIEFTLVNPSIIPQLTKLLPIKDAALQLATATALQRFHTPAAVVLLGAILETQGIEKPLALIAAKGLADFANGCPMTTQNCFRTPADYFPHCDEKAAFRTDETVANNAPRMDVIGDDDWHITFWKHWWLRNGLRVAPLAVL